jgi:hypothetical protein
MKASWIPACGALLLAALASPAAAGEVWAPNPLVAVYEGPDCSAKDDPKCLIRLATGRGGAVSGQVVVSSKAPIKGPEARMGDLEMKDGKGGIPASCVEVRYALPTGVNGISKMSAGCTGIFDALSPRPRETGSVHPVWITVNVPADAAPGEYEGALSVAGRAVPVRLFVSGWSVPKPEDFATWVDFIESPESVAMRYGVPLWSERHFELMASCFRQLGKVGNKTLYLSLAGYTNLGNEQTIVRWIPKAPQAGGDAAKWPREFTHDFAPAEKYLDACVKNMGKPQLVIFHVYEDFYGGSCEKGGQSGIRFTQLDPATGKVEVVEGPTLNNANPQGPNYPDDTVNFLKPVFDGLRDRLKERGIGEEAITFGLSRDMSPGKPTAETLLKAAPYGKWAHHGHGIRLGLHKVLPPGYCTTVWNAAMPQDPAKGRTYGWQNKNVVLMNDRDIWKPEFAKQLVRSRLLGELNIAGKQRGFGRMSADFWPCIKDAKGNLAHGIASRYPRSNWVQLNLRQTPYLYPGPDGALSTVRFEMLREGVEECEARIFVEKALLDQGARAKLGDDLAKRAQDLLDERVRALLTSLGKGGKTKGDGLQESSAEFANTDWQGDSQKLYALAGEVADKLK